MFSPRSTRLRAPSLLSCFFFTFCFLSNTVYDNLTRPVHANFLSPILTNRLRSFLPSFFLFLFVDSRGSLRARGNVPGRAFLLPFPFVCLLLLLPVSSIPSHVLHSAPLLSPPPSPRTHLGQGTSHSERTWTIACSLASLYLFSVRTHAHTRTQPHTLTPSHTPIGMVCYYLLPAAFVSSRLSSSSCLFLFFFWFCFCFVSSHLTNTSCLRVLRAGDSDAACDSAS